jgi:hypothetical protein
VFQRALRPPWWWGARNSIGASTRGRPATASVGERAGGARASQRAAGEDGVSGALACGACRWGRAGPLPAARGLAGRFPRELASMSIGDFLCCFAAAAVDHCLPSVALFRSGWQELDLYGPTADAPPRQVHVRHPPICDLCSCSHSVAGPGSSSSSRLSHAG